MAEDQTPFEKASSQIREALNLLKKQDIEAGLPEDFYKLFPYTDFPVTMYIKDTATNMGLKW